MGGNIRLRKGTVPHIFECQRPTNIKVQRSVAIKRNRRDVLQGIEELPEAQLSTSSALEWVDCGSAHTETDPIELSDKDKRLTVETCHVKD